ncbi:MAG: hypothetical protein ACI9WV_001139 [Patiriisocius sp.]|jgi:hypothetical protein
MGAFEEKKNISNLRDLVYQINGRNSYVIAKEFDFDEYEEAYIRDTFWPIITLNEIDVDSIIAKTIDFKEEFINYYKEFDIDIFKKEYLDFFEYEIKEFLSVIRKRGKCNVWAIKKDKNFYHLKLESEKDTPRHQTLLITEKDEIQLELYFKKIIAFIERFTEEHRKLELNQSKTLSILDKQTKKGAKNNYSQKQVAIAYFFLDIPINEGTYLEIITKYTTTTSNKILQKLITKNSQLTTVTGNKTSDTKHKTDLIKVKGLLSGIKNEKALDDLNEVITTFQDNYDKYYK